MDTHDDLTTRILESLTSLPEADQSEIILAVIGAALKTMSVYRILQVRADISAELSRSVALVDAALDLIEGQLALREIAGDAGWR